MKVPRVEAKLRVFAFRITFSTQVGTISPANYVFSIVSHYAIEVTDFLQVDELRTNLTTINDATKEVQWYPLIILDMLYPCFYLFNCWIYAGQRVPEITADNADHPYARECIESRDSTRYLTMVLLCSTPWVAQKVN
jgi:hypothetical protein